MIAYWFPIFSSIPFPLHEPAVRMRRRRWRPSGGSSGPHGRPTAVAVAAAAAAAATATAGGARRRGKLLIKERQPAVSAPQSHTSITRARQPGRTHTHTHRHRIIHKYKKHTHAGQSCEHTRKTAGVFIFRVRTEFRARSAVFGFLFFFSFYELNSLLDVCQVTHLLYFFIILCN